jgi:glutathione S-transferase
MPSKARAARHLHAVSSDPGVSVVSATLAIALVTLVGACVFRRRRARPILYVHPVSAPARATLSLVRACELEAKGRITLKAIALEKGEHKQKPFLAVNPNGSVPALQDGELKIGESHTIMRYLCARFQLPDRWYPLDPVVRSRVDEQLDWHHAHARKGVPYFFHRYIVGPFFNGKPDRDAQLLGKEAYLQALIFLNKHQLARRKFLAADYMTIADLVCYAELGPMHADDQLGPRIQVLPNVVRWMAAMRAESWHDSVHADVHALVRRGVVAY